MMIERIRSPQDLRALSAEDLAVLTKEIREFLIERVCRTGGHLGPNLGVVELSIALHRVFDSPGDRILWDTGHQSYVHKLLTGRAAGFDLLRKRGGLSGYPSRAESEHDLVENSHASTALSYADGLAAAGRLRGQGARAVVAVVGDGALTGGIAWEALNNIAARGLPVIVVLNDNGRSYAPTVGGLADHLAALRAGRAGPSVFEEFGLAYVGPVDGHDIAATESALRVAREIGRPVVVHCLTVKGRGYAHAEDHDLDRHHAVPPTDPGTGRPAGPRRTTWTDVFAAEIVEIGAERPDVVALSAAMVEPAGLLGFQQRFPARLIDVGIAEQHAVASAAGLAMGGLHPVVCVYSTFLNRAFDQVLMDVALHTCPVTFVLDRAGATGDDGPSHNGMWDLSILNVVPGLAVAAPRDAATLRSELREAVATPAPTAIRYPKGALGPDVPPLATVEGVDLLYAETTPRPVEPGTVAPDAVTPLYAETTPRPIAPDAVTTGTVTTGTVTTGVVTHGMVTPGAVTPGAVTPGAPRSGAATRVEVSPGDALIVSVGAMADTCVRAARLLRDQGIGVTVADPRWIKPVAPGLAVLAGRHRLVVTVEDCGRSGAFGAALAQAFADAGVSVPVRGLGLPQRFLDHGSRAELLAECGLTAQDVADAVAEVVACLDLEAGLNQEPAHPQEPAVLAVGASEGTGR